MYLYPDDTANVPGSLVIKYDNTEFRIFLTDDTLTCYLCKKIGHTSNYCKKELKNMNVNNHSLQETSINNIIHNIYKNNITIHKILFKLIRI